MCLKQSFHTTITERTLKMLAQTTLSQFVSTDGIRNCLVPAVRSWVDHPQAALAEEEANAMHLLLALHQTELFRAIQVQACKSAMSCERVTACRG